MHTYAATVAERLAHLGHRMTAVALIQWQLDHWALAAAGARGAAAAMLRGEWRLPPGAVAPWWYR